MAVRQSSYNVSHRRRREEKTDYRRRLGLLKSGKARLVVRKHNRNILCQVIQYGKGGDRTIASAHSRDLKKSGWGSNTGSIPSAYLTGLLCGVRAKGKVSEAVFDAGMNTSTKGSRLYAALKGFIDSGVSIPHSKEILPDEKRISGEHIPGGKKPKNFKETVEKIMKG